MAATKLVTDEELDLHHCLEAVDIVADDDETTAFKRRARLQQACWRETRQMKAGSEPMRPREGRRSRSLGSRMDVDLASAQGWNFLTASALEAARARVAHPEPHETLDVDRLFADLLSSMPMCFNLFGPITVSHDLMQGAMSTWWPEAPGKVRTARFEWSPGRRIPGEFLENRSAFDVAFELELGDGRMGIIGIETKYHEHCKREKLPAEKRLRRYEHVTWNSGIFRSDALDSLLGTRLQQIWLDHLLALSMLQHPSGRWAWAKFVLVHPAQNPSYGRAAVDYARILADSSTFEVRTIESLLAAGVIPRDASRAFNERYLW